ncbi:MAG: FAD-dependent oxidoreductase, partial [Proteobacteria bacterium]|nr:FAD-dependent oxidoreductase [Pseudomonadota bacterium]
MKGSVLVVGAGPAGMRASSELVNQGFKVFLVEEKPTIGGKMAQIDKMFPSNECSTCSILPRMLEITSNPNINIISFAEVKSISGTPGNFKVEVLKKPRYVDPMKCNACTACFPVCPVGGIPVEFNCGRGASKAITFYSPFPPRKALINPEK